MVEENKKMLKEENEVVTTLRHREFPVGPPSMYHPGPMIINFRDQTRPGVFIVVW